MTDRNLAIALGVLTEVWDDQQRSVWTELQLRGTVSHLPDLSLTAAQARSAQATKLLARIDSIEPGSLPHGLEITVRQARHRLASTAREADWYWLVIDPSGAGFFAMFGPSAYCFGFVGNYILQGAGKFAFTRASDLDRYLALVSDYARMVDQIFERTLGQAERGIRIPKMQVKAARAVATGFKSRSLELLAVADERLAGLPDAATARFTAELHARLSGLVGPAFDRLVLFLGPEYEALAPSGVGMSQYEGGAKVYEELVKSHTTTTLTPQQIHDLGLERLAGIHVEMTRIRGEVGMENDPVAYLSRMSADPRFSATTTDAVTAVFQRYIDRLDAVFDQAFFERPDARPGVAPLAEALEGSMTFGYYDGPKPGDPVGRFFFNARNLKQQPLHNIAALTYHELMPGHHYHLSMQRENTALHPIGRHAACGAFNEGWAEYAATLAGEMGMYEEIEETYGRLVMDAFLTSRLVVDTGMNALGWSLEKARDFMRRNSSMSEAEVQSESLRYSCDLPAQALAYKLGDTEMMRLRERMRKARGADFDVRDFHAAVMEGGAMPFPDLAWHLDHVTAEWTASRQ